MEINNSNFNSKANFEARKKNNKTNKEPKKPQKNFEYSKINHPSEVLGRSMVNFRGKKPDLPKITREELLEQIRNSGILEDNFSGILFESGLKEGQEPFVAAIFNIIKDREDLDKNQKISLLSNVNEENFNAVKIIAEDGKSGSYIQEFGSIENVYKYATNETAFFMTSILRNEEMNDSEKRNVFTRFVYDKNFKKRPKEEVIKTIAEKARVYKKIEETETDNKVKLILLKRISKITEQNLALATKAIKSGATGYEIESLLSEINEENAELAEILQEGGVALYTIGDILRQGNEKTNEEYSENIKAKTEAAKKIKEVYGAEKLQEYGAKSALKETTSSNKDLLISLIEYGKKDIGDAEEVIRQKYYIKERDEELYAYKKQIADKYKGKEGVDFRRLCALLSNITLENGNLLEALFEDKDFSDFRFKEAGVCGYLCTDYEEQKEIFDTRKLFYEKSKEKNPNFVDYNIVSMLDVYNVKFARKILKDGIIPIDKISGAISSKETIAAIRTKEVKIKEKLYDRLKQDGEENDTITEIVSVANRHNINTIYNLLDEEDFPNLLIGNVAESSFETRENFYKQNKNNPNITREDLLSITCAIEYYSKDYVEELLEDENFPNEKISESISYFAFFGNNPKDVIDERMKIYHKYKNNDKIDKKVLAEVMACIGDVTPEKAEDFLLSARGQELTPNSIRGLLQEEIKYEDFKKALDKFGKAKINSLSEEELVLYIDFADAYKINNLNELSIYGKRSLLRGLVKSNADLFELKDEIRKDFPMLPKNQEEYCSLLPGIVKSLGLETNSLDNKQIKEFEKNISALSDKLKNISDKDFNKATFTLEYTGNDFILDVVEELKDLTSNERQKVFDYFGFELENNKTNETGYSIVGYPMNLNNGKKLSQITDPKTKETIEKLRPIVVKFIENNKVQCTNEELEPLINGVIEAIPELRSSVGRIQAGMNDTKGSHEFDIFKHSLKVMQKIAQNPEFENLNVSDKKLMLLASLLHDISKKEGRRDAVHNHESSFDAYYISKKFNLSKDEEIKLYTLIKNHEWLGYVNSGKNDDDTTKRLQSTAYDFRHDNLFDMALIFTHADLKAVRSNNDFHDRIEGRGRRIINGKQRSFGESADIYAGKKEDDLSANTIRGYINELKKSQPVLPVTRFPKASEIEKAITVVNPDGSTNIKGVYKDENGIVVVKYNEVENFEEIGFDKGTFSRGIKTSTRAGETIDTGNIKFIAHGLDYANQLIKFDAFGLPDSDALLSVSYSECPETKYRFFRPQGVILNVKTKQIHGGGETDAGSGYRKNINAFKRDYLFGGIREEDRLYVSTIIKEALEMTDEEYIKFVKENENKPMNEIVPKEKREALIKAFANINSNERNGSRAYNEMYITNPDSPMAAFVYDLDADNKIGNPIKFLNRETISGNEERLYKAWHLAPMSVKERTAFIKDYVKERDLPIFVFGD